MSSFMKSVAAAWGDGRPPICTGISVTRHDGCARTTAEAQLDGGSMPLRPGVSAGKLLGGPCLGMLSLAWCCYYSWARTICAMPNTSTFRRRVTTLAYRSVVSKSNVCISCKWDVVGLGLRVYVVLITLMSLLELLELWCVPQLCMSYSHGSRR
jgi:hypothetical protein